MKRSYRFLLITFCFVAVAGIVAALYTFNLRNKDLRKSKPDFTISAEDLVKAFEKDENSASNMYLKMILDVTGIIGSINRGENDALSIALKSGSDISSVICTLAENPDTFEFRTGDHITIRGECSGFLMDVLLNNCIIVR